MSFGVKIDGALKKDIGHNLDNNKCWKFYNNLWVYEK